MSKNVVIGVVVVIVIILIGWFLMNPKQSTAPTPSEVSTPPSTDTESPASSSAEENQSAVSITADGFSPQSITIKVGESVTWTNSDSANHNVSSDPHPTHTDYPPLNLGVIKPEASKSLTFPTAGTYTYHDHLNPSLKGSVTVQ